MNAAVTTPSITGRILCPICRAPNRPDARFCQQCGKDVLLDGIYRITRVIKEGGMGVVYHAVDGYGEQYAVKEMHDRFTDADERAEGIERFIDEAKLLRNLKGHPAIPRVYRSFIDEGRYYLSMEFIVGEDLEDKLERTPRFGEAQVLRWADQLCDVLEYLHDNGLIYRDMKPSNVMITPEDDVKVVDFGIAKLLQPGQRGTMIGTPGYAPPEQYQGIATPQSDVYALAATLHHLVTGRDPREEPPFSFPPARDVRPEISRQLSDALEKALEMEVADRFRTVSEFRRALPIPTGDVRPTRTFDPVRPTPDVVPPARSGPSVSAAPVQPLRPQPAAPPRPAAPARPAAPVRPPATPPVAPRPAQSARRQARRRRSSVGGTVRRLVAATLIGGGLAFGGYQYGPQIVEFVQTELPTLVEQFSGQTAAPEAPVAPAAAPIQFTTKVEIQVPENASRADIVDEYRAAYLANAQQQYAGAELIPNFPPTLASGEQTVGTANGMKTLRATVTGQINVPQN